MGSVCLPPTYLVFDLDGTISDPVVGIGRSINYALQFYRYPEIAQDQVSHLIGPPLDVAFQSITGTSEPAELAALVAKYRERYTEVGYCENVLYPGVPEVLDALASLGVPLGICTSKRVDIAERILQMFGLRRHFEFLSGGEIGVHKKQQLASLLSDRTISPDSIMIGDRAVDIEAAKLNGLGSVGVLWGHGSAHELKKASPTMLLEFPHQLVELRHVLGSSGR